MRYVNSMALLWAGLAIGGNLIAAPAKFQVDSLTMAQLLQVGRAQFAWLGVAELTFLAAILAGLAISRRLPPWTMACAMAVFGLQQLLLQPMLQARSDVLIAGGPASSGHLHLVFIAAELAKVTLLLWAAWFRPDAAAQPQSNTQSP